MSETFCGKVYVKDGCPFSCRFLVFMAEAGLLHAVEIVRCDPRSPLFEEEKFRLQTWLGADATFPAAEVEPGRYEAGSDRLIDLYAHRHGIHRESLTVLPFYEETIQPKMNEVAPNRDELKDVKHSAQE